MDHRPGWDTLGRSRRDTMLLQDDVNQQIGQAILNSWANASVLEEPVDISRQSLQGVNENSIRGTTASSRHPCIKLSVNDWHHVCGL